MKLGTALRTGAALIAAVTLVALLGLVVVDPGRIRSLTGADRASAPTATPSGDSVAQPVTELNNTPPAAAPEPAVDPANPFAGSPAAGWPSGIAGLAMPKPKRVGRFPAAEVAKALDQAKRYVAVSLLDPRVLAGAYPRDYLALLDPKSAAHKTLTEALRHPSKERNPSDLVTRFDPKGTRLHGSVIKLKGTATVTSPSRSELDVTVQLTVVYAVRKAGSTPPEVQRVVVREKAVLATYRGMDTTRGKAWLKSWSSDAAGVHCDSPDGFMHPAYDSDTVPGPEPTGTAVDPYDPRQPLPAGEECGVATRT